MDLPFFMLAYGEFQDSMKVFSYEDHGEYLVPVFTDLEHANNFAKIMGDSLKQNGDNRELLPHVCDNIEHAISMFTAMSVNSQLVQLKVIVNPKNPFIKVSSLANDVIKKIEKKKAIVDVVDDLMAIQSSMASEKIE